MDWYWWLYTNGSVLMIYTDKLISTNLLNRLASMNLYHIIDNDKLIMKNLPQVNICESICLYQYWQIYLNVLIWTNLTQCVNTDQTTLMGWCWKMYLDRTILMNLLHMFNLKISTQWFDIYKSTLKNWYQKIYPVELISMHLHWWVNNDESTSMN